MKFAYLAFECVFKNKKTPFLCFFNEILEPWTKCWKKNLNKEKGTSEL